TGVPVRTIRDIKRRFIETGDPTPPKRETMACQPRSLLSESDMQFLQASIERRPDAYLSELADDLRNICGLETTGSTVWRALHRAGYTRKQV
ncbi:hypothetical protein M407DRAFT_45235, partial [Tulasnella calospora MUT 4182]